MTKELYLVWMWQSTLHSFGTATLLLQSKQICFLLLSTKQHDSSHATLKTTCLLPLIWPTHLGAKSSTISAVKNSQYN
jgi:hypothetical protein